MSWRKKQEIPQDLPFSTLFHKVPAVPFPSSPLFFPILVRPFLSLVPPLPFPPPRLLSPFLPVCFVPWKEAMGRQTRIKRETGTGNREGRARVGKEKGKTGKRDRGNLVKKRRKVLRNSLFFAPRHRPLVSVFCSFPFPKKGM